MAAPVGRRDRRANPAQRSRAARQTAPRRQRRRGPDPAASPSPAPASIGSPDVTIAAIDGNWRECAVTSMQPIRQPATPGQRATASSPYGQFRMTGVTGRRGGVQSMVCPAVDELRDQRKSTDAPTLAYPTLSRNTEQLTTPSPPPQARWPGTLTPMSRCRHVA